MIEGKAKARERVLIEFGSAGLTMPGQSESGDVYVIRQSPDSALLAVIDGAGHGTEAAAAANAAASVILNQPGYNLTLLMNLCHGVLKKTRGAVMSMAAFDGTRNTLTWLGVGNIEGLLVRSQPSPSPGRESMFLRGGMLGFKLPPLRGQVIPLRRGDLLIVTTDGIRQEILKGFDINEKTETIARGICQKYGKSSDDALVVAARYLGEENASGS